MKLLLECARANPDPKAIRQTVEAGVDWGTTLAQAERHGTEALLHWCLAQACPDAVPGPVAAKLQPVFSTNARKNLALTVELLRVTSLLESKKIPAVPMKGPLLAWSLYENPAVRRMSDLDILIHPDDVRRAVRLLQSHGYRSFFSCADIRFFGWNQELPLQRECIIDLHWGLLPGHFGLDPAGFWQRVVPVEIAGRQLLSFCADDLILFLCVHGSKHAWQSVAWLCDVARLIDRHPIAWDTVFARAGDAHLSRPLALGLSLVRDLLGAPVPDLPTDTQVGGLAAVIRKQLLEGGSADSHRYQLALIQRASDRFRFYWGNLRPTPADYDALRIPAALYPLYYLARPLRLVAKHSLLASRRLLS